MMVNLDRCDGNCNTFDDSSNGICFQNETEDVNVTAFIMIIGINKSKILIKHISCNCRCNFEERICKLKEKWKYDKCQRKCKNQENIAYEDHYAWNPSTCACKCDK